MKTAITAVVAASLFAVHVVTGILAISIGEAYRSRCAEMEGVALPTLTKLVFSYTDTILPVVIGGVVGLATAALAGMAMRSDAGSRYGLLLIVVSFGLTLFHAFIVWIGAALPVSAAMLAMSM